MLSLATLDMAKARRRGDLIAAAHDLAPLLRAQAAEADALRRLPDRTVEALVDAGFHRMYQPARYGGAEMDYALQIELGYALGRGAASAAWVALFYATHPFVVGMMEPAAQDEVWKRTPDALIANAFFTPASTCRPEKGGFVLDGAWIISSGVTHADWNNLNVMVPRADGPPEHRFMLVPRADYRILDDWRSAGLAGTGSHSIVLEHVFVPEHRTLKTLDCRGGPTAGSRASESPLYRLPLMAVFPAGAAAPAPGIARGALDHLAETLGGRANVAGAPVADLPTVQVRLAEAAAAADAALALLRADCAEIDRMARAGELPDMIQRTRYRRDWGYAVGLSVKAVDALHPLLGAKGLDADNPAQRAWRDLHALAAHAALSWDIQAQHFGRALLGLPPTDRRL